MRSDILRGPAVIVFGGATFYSKDDIKVEMMTKTFPVFVSNFGKVDERDEEVAHRLSFTPDGRWSDLSILFPFATKLIGTSVFGTDAPLTIWTRDGRKRIYKAAAVTKMPNVIFGSTKTLLGDMQFTCLHGEATAREDAGSLFTDSAAAYPGDAGYSVASILVQPYLLSWYAAFNFTADAADLITKTSGTIPPNGTRLRVTNAGGGLPAGLVVATDYFVRDRASDGTTCKVSLTYGGAAVDITTAGTGTHTATPAGFNSFRSKDGGTMEFTLTLEPETNDALGLFDFTFQNLEVAVKLQPEGPNVADMSTALLHQGSGSQRGRSLGTLSQDLNITGTGVYLRLYSAALVGGGEAYGSGTRNVGPAEWHATRDFTAGVADPLFYVGTSAPA